MPGNRIDDVGGVHGTAEVFSNGKFVLGDEVEKFMVLLSEEEEEEEDEAIFFFN